MHVVLHVCAVCASVYTALVCTTARDGPWGIAREMGRKALLPLVTLACLTRLTRKARHGSYQETAGCGGRAW